MGLFGKFHNLFGYYRCVTFAPVFHILFPGDAQKGHSVFSGLP